MATESSEMHMEARIARLESDVGHMRSDLAEVKSDVGGLRDKVDAMNVHLPQRFDNKMDAMGPRFDKKMDALGLRFDNKMDAMSLRFDVLNAKIENVKDTVAAARIWALVLYAALAAAMLGTMARGFGWL
jgi:hypothetical protein